MNILTKYARIREAITKLEAEKKSIEAEVTKDLIELEGTVKTRYGTLYTTTRKYWTYKPETKKRLTEHKNRIREIQQDAQNRDADSEERTSLGFRKIAREE